MTFQPFLLQENIGEFSVLPLDVHYLAAGTVYNPVVLFLGFLCVEFLWSPLSFLHLLCVLGPASCTRLPRCPCHLAADGPMEAWAALGDQGAEGRESRCFLLLSLLLEGFVQFSVSLLAFKGKFSSYVGRENGVVFGHFLFLSFWGRGRADRVKNSGKICQCDVVLVVTTAWGAG